MQWTWKQRLFGDKRVLRIKRYHYLQKYDVHVEFVGPLFFPVYRKVYFGSGTVWHDGFTGNRQTATEAWLSSQIALYERNRKNILMKDDHHDC